MEVSQQGLQLRRFRDPELKSLMLWHSSSSSELKLERVDHMSQREVEHKDCAGEGYIQVDRRGNEENFPACFVPPSMK